MSLVFVAKITHIEESKWLTNP